MRKEEEGDGKDCLRHLGKVHRSVRAQNVSNRSEMSMQSQNLIDRS